MCAILPGLVTPQGVESGRGKNKAASSLTQSASNRKEKKIVAELTSILLLYFEGYGNQYSYTIK